MITVFLVITSCHFFGPRAGPNLRGHRRFLRGRVFSKRGRVSVARGRVSFARGRVSVARGRVSVKFTSKFEGKEGRK